MLFKLLFFIAFVQLINADLKTARGKFVTMLNAYRAKHKVGAIVLDSPLSSLAQSYAEYLAHNNIFKPNIYNDQYGENLYVSYTTGGNFILNNVAKEAIDGWYNEIKDYNFNKPGFSYNTMHFTQLVWKETTKVGFGIATTNHKDQRGFFGCYVVAYFDLPGNSDGEFAQNVFRA